MKKAYSAYSPTEAHYLIALLADKGIEAVIQGDLLVPLRGEIPCNTYPEVWVQDADWSAARKIIEREHEQTAGTKAPTAPWTCPGCGEKLEGPFSDCWKCQSSRPPIPEESTRGERSIQDRVQTQPRWRLQIHLSTCVVLMFAMGGLLWANLIPFEFEETVMEWTGASPPAGAALAFNLSPTTKKMVIYGWPVTCVKNGSLCAGAAVNLVLILLLLACITFLCECSTLLNFLKTDPEVLK